MIENLDMETAVIIAMFGTITNLTIIIILLAWLVFQVVKINKTVMKPELKVKPDEPKKIKPTPKLVKKQKPVDKEYDFSDLPNN